MRLHDYESVSRNRVYMNWIMNWITGSERESRAYQQRRSQTRRDKKQEPSYRSVTLTTIAGMRRL